MACDTTSLILDYFPPCQIIKLKTVSKLFKSAIDNLNINNKVTIEYVCCDKAKTQTTDLFEYSFKCGCPHLHSIIRHKKKKYNIAKLMQTACQYDTTTCHLLLNRLQSYCAFYGIQISEEIRIKVINKVKSSNWYINTKIMSCTGHIKNPFLNDVPLNRTMVSLLMNGNYFEYAAYNFELCKFPKFHFKYILSKFLAYCPKIMRVNIGFLLGMWMLPSLTLKRTEDVSFMWVLAIIALLYFNPLIGLLTLLVVWILLYPIALLASTRISPYTF